MLDLSAELRDFQYREKTIHFRELFPAANEERIRLEWGHLVHANPHQTIFNVARELWNGGYDRILKEEGFWESKYSTFSGHCHQCTPALGLVLHALGFPHVAYLECARIRESFVHTGIIAHVPPQEEPNPAMKDEFCEIGRIPYCCLEVQVGEENVYLTGKHLRPNGKETEALLTPHCYTKMQGVFAHPQDSTRSGIYLRHLVPQQNPQNIDFSRRIVWPKQTAKDPHVELFATFLRLKLTR